jgi:hypothetical protein
MTETVNPPSVSSKRMLGFGDAWFPNCHPEVYDRIVERVIRWFPSGPRWRLEQALKQWETAIAEYNPE